MPFEVDRYLDRSFNLRSYNCWHFVREVWKDLRGQQLDEVWDWSPHGVSQAQGRFLRLHAPVSPCLVFLEGVKPIPHVGVYYQGCVLHIQQRGARYEPLEIARIGFNRVAFYTTR